MTLAIREARNHIAELTNIIEKHAGWYGFAAVFARIDKQVAMRKMSELNSLQNKQDKTVSEDPVETLEEEYWKREEEFSIRWSTQPRDRNLWSLYLDELKSLELLHARLLKVKRDAEFVSILRCRKSIRL